MTQASLDRFRLSSPAILRQLAALCEVASCEVEAGQYWCDRGGMNGELPCTDPCTTIRVRLSDHHTKAGVYVPLFQLGSDHLARVRAIMETTRIAEMLSSAEGRQSFLIADSIDIQTVVKP